MSAPPLVPLSRWSGLALRANAMMNNNDDYPTVFLTMDLEAARREVRALYAELEWSVFLPVCVPFSLWLERWEQGQIVAEQALLPELRIEGAGPHPLTLNTDGYGRCRWTVHEPGGDQLIRSGERAYIERIDPLLRDEALRPEIRPLLRDITLQAPALRPTRPRCPLYARHGEGFLRYIEGWAGVIPMPPEGWDGGLPLEETLHALMFVQEEEGLQEYLEELAEEA
ncbi:MAG: hypothetical protein H6741_21070 [Alphaproteobacteria bacterium]|nr:hypothetical protein [Alphaproteobacteria bacterium]